jgi:hypothetical protein
MIKINNVLKERHRNKNFKYKSRYNLNIFFKIYNKTKTESYYIQNYNGHYFLDKIVSILFKVWF